jgi:hypothetical protein
MIFADASPLPNPSPAEFMVWLACTALAVAIIAFIAMAFNQVAKAKDRIAGRRDGEVPQPLEVRSATEFVRKHEFDRERLGISRQMEELKLQMAEQTRVSAVQRKSLYDKIDGVRKEVSDKIDAMPAQIVSQLVNTKHLWGKGGH